MKNIIKLSVKVGMLERSDKFSAAERSDLVQIQKTLRTVAKTLISFYQVSEVTNDRQEVASQHSIS